MGVGLAHPGIQSHLPSPTPPLTSPRRGEGNSTELVSSPAPQPATGASTIRARFSAIEGATRIADLYEQGALRLRMPRPHGRTEAILLNTGGGIAGGDVLDIAIDLDAGARLVATTQAAEKIYRAHDRPATIATRLGLADGARLDWLPQETILFDRARLRRTLDVDMAASATLTALETVVFGRQARGETVVAGLFRDRWRIRRGGRLVLAEDIALDGPIAALLARPAIGGGARAIATLVHIAPDATDRLDAVRRALHDGGAEAGASAWNGLLVARFASPDAGSVRRAVAAAASALIPAALPRAWDH